LRKEGLKTGEGLSATFINF